jgi:putative SOS response-associated peptidase YedK
MIPGKYAMVAWKTLSKRESQINSQDEWMMCGRFILRTDLSVIVESFGIEDIIGNYSTGNNISPGQQIASVIHDDKNRLVSFHWGFIPSWAKDPSIGNQMINARAETVSIKPSFQDAFKKRRCLIVADGFYEWAKKNKKKVPYHFSLKSGAPFGFAGLYETWTSPDNKTIKTCTIITTNANKLLRPIHDRMPVIVPKDKEALWIDSAVQDQKEFASVLQPYPAEEMEMAEGFVLPHN